MRKTKKERKIKRNRLNLIDVLEIIISYVPKCTDIIKIVLQTKLTCIFRPVNTSVYDMSPK